MAVKGFSIGLLFAFILVGCGGGDGGSTGSEGSGKSTEASASADESEVSTGYFVDSPVKGLNYRTESQEGLTGPLGQFSYLPGETITFSIGATELGSARAVGFMMPQNLDEDRKWDGTRSINIARLLITLDADQNPRNGLVIDDEAHEAFADLGFDLSRPTSEFGESEVLLNALANAGRSGLVSVPYARDHLISTYSQLSPEVTEADIVDLIDTSPNYAGRQSPMTPTPDNLRKGAKVLWADPATPGPDLHWMFEWVNPNLLLDIAERRLQGLAQAPGIRVVGEVEGIEGVVAEASLIVTFDDFELNGWKYRGSIGAVFSESEPDSSIVQPSAAIVIELDPEIDTYLVPEKPEFYDYQLFFYDLRVTGSKGYFGIHGWQNILQSVENDELLQRSWTMDATLREINSERFVRVRSVLDLPIAFTETSTEVNETLEVESEISGAAYVTHWELGSYIVSGALHSLSPDGSIDYAVLEFLTEDAYRFGQLYSITLPDSIDLQERVRAEVLSGQEGSVSEFEVFKNEAALSDEPVEDASPIWVNSDIKYAITKEGGTTPVGIEVYWPPKTVDPDGDPVRNLELTWIIDGAEIPIDLVDGAVMMPVGLDLPADKQSAETNICFRNRTTYTDVTMEMTLGIDLSKEEDIVHTVLAEDAPCESL